MAAARNNLSRRAVLGAAFAAPALLAATAEAGPARAAERRRWDRAFAALRRADAAAEAFRIHHMHPADHAYHAVRDRWPRDYDFSADPQAHAALTMALAVHEPLEEHLNDLEGAKAAAIIGLLKIPAPICRRSQPRSPSPSTTTSPNSTRATSACPC
jgi:hypothetical protein